MNLDFWVGFWASMPGEMRIILALFLGGTIHFMRNKQQGLTIAITGAFTAMLTGFAITMALVWYNKWTLKEVWFVATLTTFIANYFLGGMETMGKQFEKTPVKWIVNVLVESYLDIRAKLKGNDNDTTIK